MLSALAVLLVWQVISRSLVAYLAEVAPEAALSLSASNPTALLNLADKELDLDLTDKGARTAGATVSDRASHANPDVTVDASDRIPAFARFAFTGLKNSPNVEPGDGPGDASGPPRQTTEHVRTWAELALHHDPLNARALRILGQLADDAADEEGASRLMQAAVHRTNRESVAVYWLMQNSVEKQDYVMALHYADVLLRTRQRFSIHLMPMLAQMAEAKETSDELKRLLAKNPPWRGKFFSALLNNISDARTPLDLLLSIKDTPSPPSPAALHGYLNFLIGYNFYELAHYTWLQFLPPEQLNSAGLLFNGSFEVVPSGMPFDWMMASGPGVTIDIAARADEDGQHALLMDFGHGRVEFGGITQLIMLSPGSYQLRGKYKGQITGPRGLEWRVMCAGGQTPLIGKGPMVNGVTPEWKDFEFLFTVPDDGCGAQHLRLELAARSASEQLVSGFLWYDELTITRIAEALEPTD
jgi:hypothetical protein